MANVKLRFLCLGLLVFGCGVTFTGHCSERGVLDSNVFENASLKSIQVTNVTEVGWQILKGLERIIEVRCALLLACVRYHHGEPINKEYCKKRLNDVELGKINFRTTLFDVFSRFYDMQREGEPYSEAVKEVSIAISNMQDSLESDLLRRCNPGRTSPPTKDYYTKQDCSDIMIFLSPEEKRQFILLYTFFKSEFLKICGDFITQNKEAKNFYQQGYLFWHKNPAHARQPTEAEVNFVISVITDQGGLTNSVMTSVFECKTNTVGKTKMDGNSK